MSEATDFRLPDVGEGLTEAEIVNWKVKPGDQVDVNDVIVEIETAKSLVELPSPRAGTVGELLAGEGDTVEVGATLMRYAEAAAAAGGAPAAAPAEFAPGASEQPGPVDAGQSGEGDKPATLVGYGPKEASTKRRPRRAAPSVSTAPATTPVPEPAPAAAVAPEPPRPVNVTVLAKPPVRKLAKDLGVDLTTVSPTGPDGTVTRADVEGAASAASAASAMPAAPAVPAAQQGPVASAEGDTRVPVRGVRKATAAAMVASAFTAPHVTEWVEVDASATMELVERLKARRDFADVKVSPLLIIAKACCLALRRTPEMNASWDEPAQEIVLKGEVNLGIAAATPRGLVVPNIRGAGRLGLVDLARELGELTRTAREGKTQPAQMQGTSFSITNVGVFGVDAGTPILNPGESGILAVGAIRKKPWVVPGPDGEDTIAPRWVTTLAVSFDHRIVDGEQGSRFLADVAAIVQDPAAALLYA